MPKILTDVDTFSADVTVPEGGDARTAASVEPAFQKLANRTRWAKNLLDPIVAMFDSLGLSVNLNDPTVPLLATTKTASDDPAGDAFFKLLFAFPTGDSGIYARVYSTNDASNAIGHLYITINAEWDPVANTWSADATTQKASKLSFAVTGSVSNITFSHRDDTSIAWGSGSWENSPHSGGAMGNLFVSGDYRYPSTRSRTVALPPFGGNTTDTAGAVDWFINTDNEVECANAGAYIFPIRVPTGCNLTGFGVICEQVGTDPITVDIRKQVGLTSAPAAPAHTSVNSGSSSGAAGLKYVAPVISQLDLTNTDTWYYARISSIAPGDKIHGFLLFFGDKGPRNL